MGIFNNNMTINNQEPFVDDKLGREKEISELTQLFDIVGNEMVLAINSPWGTGKTTFLKMWNQYLKNNEYKTIFFNAWENDFVEDAFIAFVNEIREAINDESRTKSFIDKAKKVVPAIIKQLPQVMSTAVKNTTGFDTEQVIANDTLENVISSGIDQYNINKDSIHKFRAELEKLALDEYKNNGKPMIVFIDELDRCKPTYALNLLERIKHIFNVENIVFILGIDKDALGNSVKKVYGEQTNANAYLTRFIDMEYTLKQNKVEDYIYALLIKYRFNDIFSERAINLQRTSMEIEFTEFNNLMKVILVNFNVSLRDMEKILFQIYIILKANANSPIYPYPLIVLTIIRKIDKNIYYRIRQENLTFKEFIEWTNTYSDLKSWFESESNEAHLVKSIIIWLLNDKKEVVNIKDRIKNNPEKNNYLEERYIELADFIDKIYGKIETDRGHRVKSNIYEKIELYKGLDTLN